MTTSEIKNGMTISRNELETLLAELGITYVVFIDGDTHNEFLSRTGFNFQHNYNDCETYTLTEW